MPTPTRRRRVILKELGVAASEVSENPLESEEPVEEDAVATKKSAKANIQRYKGLGEMNPKSSGRRPWTRNAAS